MREPSYPDARPNTFRDGIEFQDFVCVQLARYGIILQNLASKKYQYDIGENLQGFEIKLDARHMETGRLSIEIAEKTRAANPTWVPSGIYREDNSWLYIQGNYQRIYVFDKGVLKRYHRQKRPNEYEHPRDHPTVRKFYLPHKTAEAAAAKVICL
jgi:hypothetical protein